MSYEESAKEVLRLVQFFEGLFVKSGLYCETAIAVDVDPDGKDKIYFKWSPRMRQLQYRGSFNDSWAHAARVFEMEIPGILLKNIEALYDACMSEQTRVTAVLGEASDTGSDFGDRLVLSLSEKEDQDAGNE
jgi:hypothetical protein